MAKQRRTNKADVAKNKADIAHRTAERKRMLAQQYRRSPRLANTEGEMERLKALIEDHEQSEEEPKKVRWRWVRVVSGGLPELGKRR